MNRYLSGEALYGDDFGPSQIEAWYREEEHGYADLGAKDRHNYEYGYHRLNFVHGFSKIAHEDCTNVLAFGSAYGDELIPIEDRIAQVALLDASESFRTGVRLSCPTAFHQAKGSGDLPFVSNEFDLVTCFGVLHHIPNVSHVVREIYRCLKPGGILLVREPIISMGDWTKPRIGLTKNERGIPADILLSITSRSGFSIRANSPCMFPLSSRLGRYASGGTYNSPWIVFLDQVLSRLTFWNSRYHRVGILQKIAPTCVFLVAEKPK